MYLICNHLDNLRKKAEEDNEVREYTDNWNHYVTFSPTELSNGTVEKWSYCKIILSLKYPAYPVTQVLTEQ